MLRSTTPDVRRPTQVTRLARLVLAPLAAATLLAACGGDDGGGDDDGGNSSPDQTVQIDATEYEFRSEAAIEIMAGQTIRFEVANVGELTHEMQVLDDDGTLLDRTERIAPGDRDDVTVTFETAGTYQVICDIDDHLTRGQRAQFPVVDG